MAPDEEKLDRLLDRFERVASARAESGKLDAPADEVLADLATREPSDPEDIETWWSRGERVEAAGHMVFQRVLGDGPWLSAIHGFPTSCWDWEPVSRTLRRRRRILVMDLLGFGDSDKPALDWSASRQADIIEALWARNGVSETSVLAHDVGLTVALELLARDAEGRLAVNLTGMVLLNGGVYAGFHRPRPIQVWLQRPLVGALISRMLTERRFSRALAEVFGPNHQPSSEDLHQHWLSVARHHGSRQYHRLIRYIPERRSKAQRWEAAVEQTRVPLRFAWGMADPVSGAHMAAEIRARRPGADVMELADVGHYPHLEAPDAVAAAVGG